MKWLISLGVIFVFLIGGALIAPSFIDWSQYKSQAVEQAEKMAGLKLEIGGDLSLAILPTPHLNIEKVRVADPKNPESTLAAFEALDVYVAVAPLLSGQVKITSLTLDKPDIALSKDAQGRFNFMTPQIEAMMNGKEAAAKAEPSSVEVGFDRISISEGRFTYKDAGAAALVLNDINMDVNADSLQGPFALKGKLAYGELPVSVNAKTGKIDGTATSLNMKGNVAGADVAYAGVVGWGEAPEVSGEADISISSLSEFAKGFGAQSPDVIKGGVGFKGMVKATPQAASVTGAALSLGGYNFTGDIEAGLSPLTVSGDLIAKEIVNFDALMPKSSGGAKGGFPDFGAMLPQTLELPQMGAIDLKLSAPGFVYNGNSAKGMVLEIGHKDKSFAVDMRVDEAPGKAIIQAGGVLSYAEKSTSAKSGKSIFSNPALNWAAKGRSQNAAETVRAMAGLSGVPILSTTKVAIFDMKGIVSKSGLVLSDSTINLDDLKASASGSFKKQEGSDRPLLAVKAVVSDLNFDQFSEGGDANASSDPTAALKNLALPFDLDADVMVNSALMQGQQISGLKLDAKILPNTLILDNVGAQNFAGAKGAVSGKIGDLKALSGLDLTVKASAADPYQTAKAFKVDTSSWPQNIGAASVDAKASGTITQMNVDANVSAMSGQVGVKGVVTNPLTALSMNNMAVRVKHSSLKGALGILGIEAPAYASLSKPIDISMDVGIAGQVYTLANIKGDLSGADVRGASKIDLSGAKPSVQGDFQFGRIVLQSVKGGGSSAGSSSGGASAASSGGGKWSSAPLNTQFLHSMNADFKVSASSLLYEGWDMDKPSLAVTLRDGVMTLSDLKAGLYDGQIGLKGALSSTGPDAPAVLQGSANIQNVNMEPLVKSFTGNRILRGQGNISMQTDVNASGGSMKALIGSMAGQGSVSGSSIVLDGIDVTRFVRALSDVSKPGDSLLNLWKGVGKGGSTAFDTLDGSYVIENGVVTFQKLLLDGPRAAIDTRGTVNFPLWRLNTEHEMSVKDRDDVPPFTLKVNGPLDNPAQSMAGGAINNYLQKKIQDNLGKLLGDKVGADSPLQGVIGGLLGAPQAQQQQAPANDNQAPAEQQQEQQAPAQQQQQPQQIKPEDAVKGLLKEFLR